MILHCVNVQSDFGICTCALGLAFVTVYCHGRKWVSYALIKLKFKNVSQFFINNTIISRLSMIVRVIESWRGLLLLTVTDVSTTCAVVIFRVKVSCITLDDGIKLWLFDLTGQLKCDVIGPQSFKPWCYWISGLEMSLVCFDPCLVTVKQL